MRRLALLPAVALAILPSLSCSPGAGQPVVGTWTMTGAMNEPRWEHSLTVLADGRVLAAGGCADWPWATGTCHLLDTAEIFDPVTGIWVPTGSMNEPRSQAGAVLLRDGTVLVAGGWSAQGGSSWSHPLFLTSAELYDPATGRWTRTGEMGWQRDEEVHDLSLVLLPNGKALYVGGRAPDGTFASAAEVYDPATGAWEQTGPLAVPRCCTTAILLPSGTVLMVGGVAEWDSVAPDHAWATASAELYDPATNAWEATDPVGREVLWNTLALLPTGEVLLSNGIGCTNPSDPRCGFNAEVAIYQPAARKWRGAHPMLKPRSFPAAVPLPSGRVLLAGGNWGGWTSSYKAFESEVYDLRRDAWTLTPAMRHYREGATTGALLPSGDVLVAGGQASDFLSIDHLDSISSAEIFDEGPLPEASP